MMKNCEEKGREGKLSVVISSSPFFIVKAHWYLMKVPD